MNGEGDMYVKDFSIMLFGKKIQANSSTMNSCSNSKHKENEMFHTQNIEKSKNFSNEENESKVNTSNVEGNMETSSTDQDKVLKKPDKIVQCPRCNSFDTKFCYFNNYNVSQPRHFCRKCHRYWTAGGTMRNVPIGAGRRKNKQIASQYRHMIVASGGISNSNFESNDSSTESAIGAGRRKNKQIASQYRHMIVASGGISNSNFESNDSSTESAIGAGRRKNKQIASQYRHMIVASGGISNSNFESNDSSTESAAVFRCLNNNGIVLKFGPENASLHESNDSMFNPRNHKRNIDASANNGRENGDEESSLCVSSVTNGYTRGNELSKSEHNSSKPLQSYPTSSSMIPVNHSWNNVTYMVQSSTKVCNPYGIDPSSMQWCHMPNIFRPNIGLQFVPESFRNGSISIGSNDCISPSLSTNS